MDKTNSGANVPYRQYDQGFHMSIIWHRDCELVRIAAQFYSYNDLLIWDFSAWRAFEKQTYFVERKN